MDRRREALRTEPIPQDLSESIQLWREVIEGEDISGGIKDKLLQVTHDVPYFGSRTRFVNAVVRGWERVLMEKNPAIGESVVLGDLLPEDQKLYDLVEELKREARSYYA
jgi:hypothetical protein